MRKRKEFKYKTEFTSVARCLVDEEKDSYLSLAAFDELKSVLPLDANVEGKEDLLPIAFNSCVVNLANKNGDLIDTSTALGMYKKFHLKFINADHQRSRIIGVITNCALTKFSPNYAVGGGSELITEEMVSGKSEPFNIALGGYIYSVAYPDISELIEDSNDPNSPEYLSVSTSWEIGFDEYKILKGSQYVSQGTVIDDPTLVSALSPYLKCNGGSGKGEDGEPLYRLICGDCLPLGIGVTSRPAAAVQGIYTPTEMENEDSNPQEEEEYKQKVDLNNNLSEKSEENTKNLGKNNIESVNTIETMKIKSVKELSELTQEVLASLKVEDVDFASIRTDIVAEIEKACSDWKAKLDAEATSKVQAQELASQHELKINEILTELNSLKQKQAEVEAQERFNGRMSSIEATYTVEEAQRSIIAKQVRDLSDEGFDAWLKDFAVLAKAATKKQEAVASDSTESVDELKSKLDAALAELKEVKATLPNTPPAVTENLKQKFQNAFSDENIEIK